MRLTIKRLVLPCLAAFLTTAGGARADLSIEIYEGTNSANAYTYTTSALSYTLTSTNLGGKTPDFSFSGLAFSAQLGSTGTLKLTGGQITSNSGSSTTLTVLVTENGYTTGGPNYSMGSSSGYSSAILSNGDSLSFQSYAAPGSANFGTTYQSPGHSYSIANSPSGSGSYNEANTNFTAGLGYTLTEKYVWASIGSGGAGDTLNMTGSTIANTIAVPEPGSLLLVGLGSLGIFVLRRQLRA